LQKKKKNNWNNKRREKSPFVQRWIKRERERWDEKDK
jgi:hypothetical protein